MILASNTTPGEFDCLVLGGGITGAGVARDASMRGLRVLLIDSHDFASGTSHLTSKLIHGGLRYLDHGHIRPVIEGIVERDRLLNRIAPNLVRPLRFVMPFEGHRFPKWVATLCGLKLYGLPEWYHCGRSSDPMLRTRLTRDYPMMRSHPFAVSFWDAQTNDARLVMATLRTAEAEGATLCSYTSIREATFAGGAWTVTLWSHAGEHEWTVRARSVVNATGPWSPYAAGLLGVEPLKLTWLKGSHIVVPRHERFGDDAIVIRSVRDRRPLWLIPWYHRLIVGSTECRYHGDLRNVRPSADEVDDLFDSLAAFFPMAGLTRADIRCAYAGVRPIIPQTVQSENGLSREHRIDVDPAHNLVTITGGKLTMFRRMSEQTVDKVYRLLNYSECRMANAKCQMEGHSRIRHSKLALRHSPLWPNLSVAQADVLSAELSKQYDSCDAPRGVIEHLVQHYGQDASLVLEDIVRDKELGQPLFANLPYTLAEFAYLCRREKVVHLADLVKRRTPVYFLVDRCGEEVLPRVVGHVAPILGWDPTRQAEELLAVADEFQADMAACGANAECRMANAELSTVSLERSG